MIDLTKGIVNTNAKPKIDLTKGLVKTKSPDERVGITIPGYIERNGVKTMRWHVIVKGYDKPIPIKEEHCLIPMNKRCKLYSIPHTNPVYDDWTEKTDKIIKWKDSHEYAIVGRYWSIFKPGLKVKGKVIDNEFNII